MKLATRSMQSPNHHLWLNRKVWFIHYTVHPTPFTKERVRVSLETGDVEEARRRRDALFAKLQAAAA